MKQIAIRTFYETLLCSPGMQDTVKIDLRASRKAILLLSQVALQGMNSSEENTAMLTEVAGKEALEELQALLESCLQKATLSELREKLNHF